MTEGIIVSIIAAVGGILASMIRGLRKENKQDHGTVAKALDRIEGKIDTHIRDHAKGDM